MPQDVRVEVGIDSLAVGDGSVVHKLQIEAINDRREGGRAVGRLRPALPAAPRGDHLRGEMGQIQIRVIGFSTSTPGSHWSLEARV